mgnify:CR=1 FL=1
MCKIKGKRIKNLLIVVVCAATASIVVTLIIKSFGVEGSAVIPGVVGGVVGSVVFLKLCSKQKK